MERRSRNRSSSAGSEKMERVGDRQGKMERCCSTGQSPQRAVAPIEEEEEEEGKKKKKKKKKKKEKRRKEEEEDIERARRKLQTHVKLTRKN
jgi:Ser/Thr protein kinase RdoA (MazF antagonist)